jgi:AcrR family transcriptional regulator
MPSPWKRLADRKHERDVKREAVLLQAARSFTARGFHQTSLDDVAALLHVTKPTLYYYFANKEQILYECFRFGLRQLEQAFDARDRPGLSGRDRLVAFLGRYAEIIMSDFGGCMALVQDNELGSSYRPRIKRLKSQIDHRIRELILAGIADGSIARGDVKMTAFALAGALNWTAHWYRSDGGSSPSRIAKLFTNLFVRGLAPRSSAKRGAGRSGRVDRKLPSP